MSTTTADYNCYPDMLGVRRSRDALLPLVRVVHSENQSHKSRQLGHAVRLMAEAATVLSRYLKELPPPEGAVPLPGHDGRMRDLDPDYAFPE